jgi:hypothetical protein
MTQTDPNANVEQKSGYGVEELQVVGEQLLAKVKELVNEGNVRRIIIKREGNTILEIPLTIGVASALLAPVWVAVGVLGALLAQCSIEVIRSDNPAEAIHDQAREAARQAEIKADEIPPA